MCNEKYYKPIYILGCGLTIKFIGMYHKLNKIILLEKKLILLFLSWCRLLSVFFFALFCIIHFFQRTNTLIFL